MKLWRCELHRFFLLVVFAISILPAWSRAQVTNADCISCHGDTSLVVTDSAGVAHSLFVDEKSTEHSIHAGFDCVTCHADVKEIPHAEKLAVAA